MIIAVKFAETSQELGIKFAKTEQKVAANFGEVQAVTEYIGGEKYDGEYDVTPKVEAQTMPTKGKIMLDNVTVKAIPYFETSNTSGGTTVYIAKEI